MIYSFMPRARLNIKENQMSRHSTIIRRSLTAAVTCTFIFAPAAQAAPVEPHANSSSNSASSTHLAASEEREVILNPGEKATFSKGEKAQISFIEMSDGKQNLFQADVPAPNCIEAKVEAGGFIQVYNNCGGSEPQRVKVKIAFGQDTVCKSVQPGTRTNIGHKTTGHIDGVVLC